MATHTSHTPAAPSIPATMEQALERIDQIEKYNSRLLSCLHGIQRQIETLEPGKYILLDDGDFGGPYSGDIDSIVRDFTEEGTPCTVIQVVARHEADAAPVDFGVTPGVDYPYTLSPAACW